MSAGSATPPKVFLSHSHADREHATELDAVLVRHGAETYLDQDRIDASDNLPERLEDGISWCSVFLLIWSASAQSSRWVRQEWNLAYDMRKRIVPYRLDGVELPSPLDSLVFVSSDDRNLAFSNLLTAVFGRAFEPPPGEIFAGTWRAEFNAFGLANGTATLELRRNGQIDGRMRLGAGGVLGSGLAEAGLGALLENELPIRGRWTYESATRMLELATTVDAYGNQGSETVRILATGNELGPIRGQDLSGRTWVLQRLASKGTPSTPRAAARPEPAAADSPFEKAVAELARAHRAGDQELVELLRLELVEMLEPVLKERGQSADDFLRQIDEVLARDARDSD